MVFSVCRICCCNISSILFCRRKCLVICIASLIGVLTYRSSTSSVISFYFTAFNFQECVCANDIELEVKSMLGILLCSSSTLRRNVASL